MASQSEPFAEQGRMIRTTTSNAGQPSRPWLVWVAHRWYSWSVLAATVAGTYLAANGDLRLGNGSQLRAASPEVSWKPTSPPVNATLPEAPKAPVAPITDDDPFKAASQPVKPPAEVVPAPQVKMASEGPALPDPFKATPDAKPALDKKVGDIRQRQGSRSSQDRGYQATAEDRIAKIRSPATPASRDRNAYGRSGTTVSG